MGFLEDIKRIEKHFEEISIKEYKENLKKSGFGKIKPSVELDDGRLKRRDSMSKIKDLEVGQKFIHKDVRYEKISSERFYYSGDPLEAPKMKCKNLDEDKKTALAEDIEVREIGSKNVEIKTVKVEAYKNKVFCAECGDEMDYTGGAKLCCPLLYIHRCRGCGVTADLDINASEIEYREVE